MEYDTVLAAARTLTPEEQRRLIIELTATHELCDCEETADADTAARAEFTAGNCHSACVREIMEAVLRCDDD
jgi:hypothetical protein